MRGPVLCAHPGADIATSDIYDGLVPALRRLGVPITEFPLHKALYMSGAMFDVASRDQKKRDGPLKDIHANAADILFHAAAQSVIQALSAGCEWVLIFSGMYFHLQIVRLFRRAGLKVAVILSESPYDTSAEFAFASQADLCWTNERTCVPALRLACPRTQYLPHAFDPQKHYPLREGSHGRGDVHPGLPTTGTVYGAPSRGQLAPSEAAEPDCCQVVAPSPALHDSTVPAHDVVFVGTAFEERVQLLSKMDWSGIDLGLYGAWSTLGSRHRLRQYVRSGEIDNAKAVALYRRARVGLNLFRSSVGFGRGTPKVLSAESLSPRVLELAACGVPMVSEWRPEVEEVFGETVPTFKPGDAKGATAALRRLLADDDARKVAAQVLPRRVTGRDFDGMARTVARDLMKADADGEAWRPLEERFGVGVV